MRWRRLRSTARYASSSLEPAMAAWRYGSQRVLRGPGVTPVSRCSTGKRSLPSQRVPLLLAWAGACTRSSWMYSNGLELRLNSSSRYGGIWSWPTSSSITSRKARCESYCRPSQADVMPSSPASRGAASQALIGSRLLPALGVSADTRYDALVSVRAGFRGNELSRLWPMSGTHWRLREYPTGLFSHLFVAARVEPPR